MKQDNYPGTSTINQESTGHLVHSIQPRIQKLGSVLQGLQSVFCNINTNTDTVQNELKVYVLITIQIIIHKYCTL